MLNSMMNAMPQKYFRCNNPGLSWLLGLSLWLMASSSYAHDVWHWHGFISQGLIRAQDSNFVNNSGDWSSELTEFGMNASWQLQPSVRVAGQLMYLDGGQRYQKGSRVDYLFVNWTAHSSLDWQFDILLGRFKNMHWLYSSTRDVAMTRPLIVLPQSIYFDAFRDIAVGSDGVAVQSNHTGGFGELELNWSLGATPVSREQSRLVLSRQITGQTEQDYVQQLSAFWRPVGSAAQYGISLLDSDFNYRADATDPYANAWFNVQRFMLNWRYSAERFEFSSELMQERIDATGFLAPNFKRVQFAQGAYLLARYQWTAQHAFIASIDKFYANKDDRGGQLLPLQSAGMIAPFFGYQTDVALAWSYDIQKNLRLKTEVHWIDGTGRLGPNVVPDIAINRSRQHNVVALQLMYWF